MSTATSPQDYYRNEIGLRLKPAVQEAFESWAGLSDNDLISHLHQIRDRAWDRFPYPCLGLWVFLLPSISAFKEYPTILARIQEGGTILDLGCGFGQDLRLLAASGAPTTAMYASDLNSDLWELGYELFRDRERMQAKFIRADIFESTSDLDTLSGQIDVILACQLLHLWDWEKQLTAIKRMIKLSRKGTLVVGHQRARDQSMNLPGQPWGDMFIQSLSTFQEIWRQAEAETDTTWVVDARIVELEEWGLQPEDLGWMDQPPKGINFVVSRTS